MPVPHLIIEQGKLAAGQLGAGVGTEVDREADLFGQRCFQRFEEHARRAIQGVDDHDQVIIVERRLGAIPMDKGRALAAAVAAQQDPRVAMRRDHAGDQFEIRVDPLIQLLRAFEGVFAHDAPRPLYTARWIVTR